MNSKKKKIHIYTQYYYPVANACSNRVEKYILALKDNYDIKVVTGMPNYPCGVKEKEYKWKIGKKEQGKNGEKVIRTYELAVKNEGSLFRILNYVSFMISSFFYGLFSSKPHIIIVTSPPLFTALSVLLLHKIRKIPYILEVRDLWPESVVALGYMSRESLGYKIFRKLELSLYKNAQHIVGVTQGICDYIKEQSIDTDKVTLQYNVAEKIEGEKLNNPYKDLQSVIQGRKIALFAGNMNEAYDFETASKYIIENQNTFFVFIGDGSRKETLINNTQACKNIMFLDRMKPETLQAYIYYSDTTFIPLKDEKFFTGTFPVKGIEAIVNNKEIIFLGPKGEFSTFVEKYNLGESKNEILSPEYFEKQINGLIR